MTQQSRIRELIDEMEANPQMAEALREKLLNRDLKDLPANFREHALRLESLLQELVTANSNSNVRMDRMEQDRSTLKNMTTRIQGDRYAPDLAADLDMTYVRTLDRAESVAMASGRLTGSPRRSFVQADLVILAEVERSAAYIAAEVSYTGSTRDTAWAVRNSAVIAEATGIPCEPALISVRNDREVSEQVRDGLVHWYRLDEKDIESFED